MFLLSIKFSEDINLDSTDLVLSLINFSEDDNLDLINLALLSNFFSDLLIFSNCLFKFFVVSFKELI